MTAQGPFEVKLQPLDLAFAHAEPGMGRMSIDKQFHGDLEGTSNGEMLSAGSSVKGSAGYVAMERVTGTLHGQAGTFVLQHSATMDRGVPKLAIAVVPDSGTGALTGLRGSMNIVIEGKQHTYEFTYTIDPPSGS